MIWLALLRPDLLRPDLLRPDLLRPDMYLLGVDLSRLDSALA
jgi:hypothetical protein